MIELQELGAAAFGHWFQCREDTLAAHCPTLTVGRHVMAGIDQSEA